MSAPAAPAPTPAPAESAPAQNADPQKVADKTPAQEQPPAPPPRRTLKFKSHGQDIELDEDRAVQELQIGWGAKKKFTELDQEKKAFEARKAKLKNPEDDDSEFFQELGVDRREWLEKKLARILQQEQEEAELSPDAKRARELEAKLRQVEEEKKRTEEVRQQEAEKQEEKRHLEMLDTHVPAALQAVGLTPSGRALERMVTYMRDQLQAKVPVTEKSIQIAAQAAKEELTDDTRALIKDMDGKQIVELFGDELANKVRRYDLQRYEEKKKASAANPNPETSPTPTPQEKPVEYINEREFKRMMRQKYG